jgi:hypothetical protein
MIIKIKAIAVAIKYIGFISIPKSHLSYVMLALSILNSSGIYNVQKIKDF